MTRFDELAPTPARVLIPSAMGVGGLSHRERRSLQREAGA